MQCINELQIKARYYEKTGLIPTVDACATVVKSDSLVPDGLRNALRQALKRLKDDQHPPDWHPRSGDMVQDLVHPSMFPHIYGQTKVFKDEVVGVSNAIEKWAGKGNVIQKARASGGVESVSLGGDEVRASGYQWMPPNVDFQEDGSFQDDDSDEYGSPGCEDGVPTSYWSSNYQWLPSNAAFQDDGSVRLTSYINNLHPTRYPKIYEAVERPIETAIPAWDNILLTHERFKNRGPGRKASRFAIPDGDADDECERNWNPPAQDSAEVADAEVDLTQGDDYDDYLRSYNRAGEAMRKDLELEWKWMMLRKPVFREPKPYVEVNYDPYTTLEGTRKDKGGLFRKFKASGLQIIVKMASIELTPEKPEFPAGSWQLAFKCPGGEDLEKPK